MIGAAQTGAHRGWTRLLPSPWRDRVDWKYGADTGGVIPAAELESASPNLAFATCYRGTLGWVIRHFIRRLPADLAPYTFVDFGSGKGRALLVASEFAFADIVGVEFSPALQAIAQDNIARLSPRNRGRVRSILGDAAHFALPASDLVCYLYNPFGPPVFDAVVARIAAHARAGHEVFVIYINPRHRDVLERSGAFETIFRHRKGVIYRAAARSGARAPWPPSRTAARLTLLIWGALLAAGAILLAGLFNPSLLGIGL